jgi:hypothetical protein
MPTTSGRAQTLEPVYEGHLAPRHLDRPPNLVYNYTIRQDSPVLVHPPGSIFPKYQCLLYIEDYIVVSLEAASGS